MKKKNVFVVLFALAMVMAGSLLCGNAAPQIDRDSASSVAETAAVASANVKQLDGAGTASNPYLIRDEEDLNDIRNYTVYDTATRSTLINGYFELTSSIALESDWVPIPYTFNGTLDGNLFTIIGMSMNVNAAGSYGLFKINKGTVRDLFFSNVHINVTASQNATITVGAVAATNYGTITNCTLASSNINLKNYYNAYLGGIAGTCYGGTVSNCEVVSTCSLTSSGYIGGITAYVRYAIVTNCENSAEVNYSYNTTERAIGGIAGIFEYGGTISYCTNSGTVRTSMSGGSIGQIVGIYDQYGSMIGNTHNGSIIKNANI